MQINYNSLSKQYKRMAQIISLLKREYPDAHCSLEYKSSFQLLVSTILSAQCTDERVNRVTKNLFPKYSKPEDFPKYILIFFFRPLCLPIFVSSTKFILFSNKWHFKLLNDCFFYCILQI